jgi:hypothetical protein
VAGNTIAGCRAARRLRASAGDLVPAELKRDGITVQIARIVDAALGHVAEQASVFTRVSPAQKNGIILALKRRGHVVGSWTTESMTGPRCTPRMLAFR